MFGKLAQFTGSRRAFATMASDNGRVIFVAGLTGAAAGAATAFGMVQQYGVAGNSGSEKAERAVVHMPSTTEFKGITDKTRAYRAGEGAKWTKPVVISTAQYEPLAATLRNRLGSDDYSADKGPTLSLGKFKSGDPNIKFNWQRVVGRKVVFIFDTVDTDRFFEQLAVLQALQGFAVPDGDDKTTKWKTYIEHGKYSWGRAAHIAVVLPWYRPCQMERTSRWQFKNEQWTNTDPAGEWLDSPNALYFARLLCTPGSVPPLPGPSASLDNMPLNPLWRPPVELLFVELHEEVPVSHSVSDLGATIKTERFVPYFLDKFKGKRAYPGKANMYVLFPDRGAFDRYAASVMQVLSLDSDHVIFIQKTRVGEQISQVEKLFYEQGEGKPHGEKLSFKETDHVLIIDDFTNSGSTLFGAVKLCNKLTDGEPNVSIFVSHLVATYDPKVAEGLLQKIHALGPKCRFFTTNSIPSTTDLIKGDPQVEVVDISDFIAELVQ